MIEFEARAGDSQEFLFDLYNLFQLVGRGGGKFDFNNDRLIITCYDQKWECYDSYLTLSSIQDALNGCRRFRFEQDLTKVSNEGFLRSRIETLEKELKDRQGGGLRQEVVDRKLT